MPTGEAFARAWIEAWNRHDLEAILSHYAEDVVFTSPAAAKITGDASGRVAGKAALAAYWGEALRRIPDLHFTLRSVLAGVDSVAIRYHSSRTEAEVVEVVCFGADGLVVEAFAYYE
ncbi:MAG: nuclear transport factor 2 family protein [Phenylobacterium sp.]|uniref:nuclear transport factor 2 family protein n=1 Tax=Phenylobacterium sp. TaxID=1871053 RepID=UPI00271F1434|nr:nuclear transport factor 2 family protein [Phenylobacterium sp.]MDO8411363.1 nuclear transport factor 2 family protein [Phenylobacterium sp.]